MPNILILSAKTIPGMPAEGGWLAPLVLALLCIAAIVDARTGRVPDPLVFFGLFFTIASEGFLVDWPFAGVHLLLALAAGLFFTSTNEVWYHFRKSDAFGMGDVKWTVLAVSCFGLVPGLLAWAIGSWLGLAWMSALRLAKRPIAHVHFAPFLFIGLCAGVYWLRLR